MSEWANKQWESERIPISDYHTSTVLYMQEDDQKFVLHIKILEYTVLLSYNI